VRLWRGSRLGVTELNALDDPRGHDKFFFLGQILNMLPTLQGLGIDFSWRGM
jgi:hypothetical protein